VAAIALVVYSWAGRSHAVMVNAPGGAAEDFAYSYAADAERLLRGEPPTDEFRGPLYPAALAAATAIVPGLSMIRAGVWINALAAAGLLYASFLVLRPAVGAGPALLAIAATACVAPFVHHATHEGIDMFFAFLCLASAAATAGAPGGRRGPAFAAGVLAGLALDARWNAGFLPVAAALQFRARGASRLLAPYAAGLLVAWAPWLVLNAILHGTPFHNLNHLNVAYAMYGRGDHSDWSEFFARALAERDRYGSLAEVVLGDPWLFARGCAARLGELASRVAKALGPLGWIAPLGAALLAAQPGRLPRAAAFAPALGLALTNATYTYLDRRNVALFPFVLACSAFLAWRAAEGRGRGLAAGVAALWLLAASALALESRRDLAAFHATESRYVAWAGRTLEARPGRPLAGDWTGSGRDGIGVYGKGAFLLRATASPGLPDVTRRIWARETGSVDLPFAMRSGGSAAAAPGVHRQGAWLAAITFSFGYALDQPLMGDWDGDGADEPGTWDGSTFHLSAVAPPRRADAETEYAPVGRDGRPATGGLAVWGDWDGDGVETMGLFHDGRFALYDAHAQAPPAHVFAFGAAGDIPLAGDWDGDGIDTVGVFRAGEWILTDRHAAGPGELRFTFP